MKSQLITLCGSTRFKEEFKKVEQMLTLQGHIPLSPVFFGESEDLFPPKKIIEHLSLLHFEKIKKSDCIYVINPNNYIGESTQREILLAQEQHIPIRYFSEETLLIEEVLKQIESWKKD